MFSTDNISQIPLAIDSSKEFDAPFPASLINDFLETHEIQSIRLDRDSSLVCYNCRESVVLCSMPSMNGKKNREHKYYFRHKKGCGNNCEWKTEGLTKAQIYQGVAEGEKHYKIKMLLASTLNKLIHWDIDMARVDKYFLFSPDRRMRGKPDVHAFRFNDEFVFEVQLRSESPETILRRKELYRQSNRRLLWVSAPQCQMVSEDYQDSCLDVKQVQQDIAFSNNGNWFLFNDQLAKMSLYKHELMLDVVYWKPTLEGNHINYNWETKTVSIDQLTYRDGEYFYFDFKTENEKLKRLARTGGILALEEEVKYIEVRTYASFIEIAKQVFPTVDLKEDAAWLDKLYTFAVGNISKAKGNRVERDFRALVAEHDHVINTDTLEHLRAVNWVSDWEYGFYSSVIGRFKGRESEAQTRCRRKINLSLINKSKAYVASLKAN